MRSLLGIEWRHLRVPDNQMLYSNTEINCTMSIIFMVVGDEMVGVRCYGERAYSRKLIELYEHSLLEHLRCELAYARMRLYWRRRVERECGRRRLTPRQWHELPLRATIEPWMRELMGLGYQMWKRSHYGLAYDLCANCRGHLRGALIAKRIDVLDRGSAWFKPAWDLPMPIPPFNLPARYTDFDGAELDFPFGAAHATAATLDFDSLYPALYQSPPNETASEMNRRHAEKPSIETAMLAGQGACDLFMLYRGVRIGQHCDMPPVDCD
jgi:hypothetical protein